MKIIYSFKHYFFLFRTRIILLARAKAESIRMKTLAETGMINAISCAEVEASGIRVEALKKYGKSAILYTFVNALSMISNQIVLHLSEMTGFVHMNNPLEESKLNNNLKNEGVDYNELYRTLPSSTRFSMKDVSYGLFLKNVPN